MLLVASVAIGCSASDESTRAASLIEINASETGGSPRWSGLIKPVALEVGPDGSVFIADNGDKRVRVFDPDGAPLREFGGEGNGPGELGNIRDLSVADSTVRIFDGPGSRVVRYSSTGRYLGSSSLPGVGDETISGSGDDIVMASSARWSLPRRAGSDPWPLAMVLSPEGTVVSNVGSRQSRSSPFAGHIANFVLPAGSRDGSLVWLAYLNGPDVLLHSRADGSTRTVTRDLPFQWRTIPNDFMPSATPPAKGEPKMPFDPITFGIAVDGRGRAFVLTALEASGASGGEPQSMAVDVISPDSTAMVRRLRVSGTYSEIAVSRDGERIYLLDPSRGILKVFEGAR